MARNSTVLPAFNQVLPRIASDLRPSPDFLGMKHGRLGSCRVRPEHSETDTEQLLIGITPITLNKCMSSNIPTTKIKSLWNITTCRFFLGCSLDRATSPIARSRPTGDRVKKKQDQVGDHRNSIYVI